MAKKVFVDDDPSILEVVGDLTKGTDVLVLDDPQEAVKAAKGAEVLVSDLQMPGMNGAQVIYNAKHDNPKLRAYLFTLAANELKKREPDPLKKIDVVDVYDKTEINTMFSEALGLDIDVLGKVPYLFPEDAVDLIGELGVADIEGRTIKMPYKIVKMIPKRKDQKNIILLSDYSTKELDAAMRRVFKFVAKIDGEFHNTTSYPEAIALIYRHSPNVLALIDSEMGDYMGSARSSANHNLSHVHLNLAKV